MDLDACRTDESQRVVRIGVQILAVVRRQLGTDELERVLDRDTRIELVVVEVVVTKRGEE
jgi:hypothetical protein